MLIDRLIKMYKHKGVNAVHLLLHPYTFKTLKLLYSRTEANQRSASSTDIPLRCA